MATYTIATIDAMLIATVPDGEDIDADVQSYAAEARLDAPIEGYHIERGLTLVDEDPEDTDRIVWDAKGGHGGFLMDENETTFNYAIR